MARTCTSAGLRRPSATTSSAGVTSPPPRAPAFAILLLFTLCTMLAHVQHQHRSTHAWRRPAFPNFSRRFVRFTVSPQPAHSFFADMCTNPSFFTISECIAPLQTAVAHACARCTLAPAEICHRFLSSNVNSISIPKT